MQFIDCASRGNHPVCSDESSPSVPGAPFPQTGRLLRPCSRGTFLTRAPGGDMERSSDRHGPRIDEELDHLTQSVTRGGPVESRAEEEREQEGPGDDEPTADAVVEHYDTRDSAGDDFELRSEIARHLEPSVFPA